MASFKAKFQYFRSYLRKTTGGALWAPPPSGARVKDLKTKISTFLTRYLIIKTTRFDDVLLCSISVNSR